MRDSPRLHIHEPLYFLEVLVSLSRQKKSEMTNLQ